MDTGKKKYIYILFLLLLYLGVMWENKHQQEKTQSLTDDSAKEVITAGNDVSAYQERKKVALTFDDGPGESTKKLLDGLAEREVKATFFVVGEKVEQYPDIIARMKEEGHLIGNHTYSHVQLNALSCESAMEEIRKNSDVIEQIAGERPLYLRPPYGECTKSMKNQLDMFLVLWDVDPLDWSVQNTECIVQSVLRDVEENDIILLHDIFDTSVEAAFQIVDSLTKENYEFVTADELMFP